MTPDLSRLSAGERRVLALLAVGHTAKSAAAETGLSVHAVNERLREARRKTGAASSRELARAVGAQENRDDFIGAAAGGPEAQAAEAPTASPGSRWRLAGALTMMTLAAVAAAVLLQQPPAPEPSAFALRERVRAERVDQAWAPDAEQALEAIYAPVPGVGPVEVICAATLCEVTGTITPGNEGAATEALQAASLDAAVRRAGFGQRALIQFAAERIDQAADAATLHGDARFVAYWPRR